MTHEAMCIQVNKLKWEVRKQFDLNCNDVSLIMRYLFINRTGISECDALGYFRSCENRYNSSKGGKGQQPRRNRWLASQGIKLCLREPAKVSEAIEALKPAAHIVKDYYKIHTTNIPNYLKWAIRKNYGNSNRATNNRKVIGAIKVEHSKGN